MVLLNEKNSAIDPDGSVKRLAIRTGCLKCRSEGLKCDPNNQHCRLYSSTKWSSNRSLIRPQSTSNCQAAEILTLKITRFNPTWKGTLREKESLHFFCVISAPELSGFLDTKFWQQLLPQATHLDHAIKHAVVALGASHEYKLRKQASRLNSETDGLLPFGIRQCNKAITNLLRPGNAEKAPSLMRALTASIIFASFESLSGNSEGAVPHVVHARKLLETYKDGQRNDRQTHDFPINLDIIEPLVAHYEVQIGSYIYDDELDGTLKTFDVTAPLEFNTIGEARVPLGQAIAEYGVEIYKIKRQHPIDVLNAIAECKFKYAGWMRRWDAAFTTFLSNNRSSFNRDTLNGCRLLKAHQLAASAFAGVAYQQGESAWTAFTPELHAINDLIATMIDNLPKRGVAAQAPQLAYLSSTMGMTEPVYLVATRCTDPAVADRARELMKKLPLNEGVHSAWRTAFIEKSLCEATGKVYVESSRFDTPHLGVRHDNG